MAEEIFERFVDHTHNTCDGFEFEMELDGGGERHGSEWRGGRGREDSVSRVYPEDPPSQEPGGVPIPRRHTMDTASSLPSHLATPRHLRHRSPAATSFPRERTLLVPPSPSTSSLSLKSRASSTHLSSSSGVRRIPSILRHSFSRLFSGKTKAVSQPQRHSISASPSRASIISQQTEEIVRESLKKGLPLIPFASPLYQEESDQPTLRRETAEKADKHKSDEDAKAAKDSGYCQMSCPDADYRGVADYRSVTKQSSVTSNSSYVQMGPGEDMSALTEEPYVRMENVYPADNPAFFDFEPFSTDTKSGSHKNLKPKQGLTIEKHGYKKGNKHRDEYAFLDFSKNHESTKFDNKKVQQFFSL